jgi:hypothetical protein
MLIAKNAFRRMTITGGVVALLSATLMSGTAPAVTCGNRTDFVKVWSHPSNDSGTVWVTCFANAGWVGWNKWTDRITTGNNRVKIKDANGSSFTLGKWTDYRPRKSFAMDSFTIL